MILILKLIWLMLPAYFANMMPVFVSGIFKKLAFPLDLGKKLNNQRILGDHKTFRGFFFGILAAIAVFYAQQILYNYSFFQELSLIDYDNTVFFGFWIGFGALFFDLIKSFLKRRIGIAPGKPWLIADQLDYVIGAIVFMSYLYAPGWIEVLLIIAISVILTILVKHIGFWLKIGREKW